MATAFCNKIMGVANYNVAKLPGETLTRNVDKVLGASNVNKGIVAWWKLDENTGSSVADASGNGYGGTITGASWASPAKINAGLDFNNDADQVDITSTVPGSAATLTVAFWMKADSRKEQVPLCKYPATGGKGWIVKCRGDGTIWWRIGSGDSNDTVYSSDTYSAATWAHVVGVWESGTGKIYINGGTPASRSLSPQTSDDTTVAVDFANPQDGSGEHFLGLMDDVRIYARALSADEISNLAGMPQW